VGGAHPDLSPLIEVPERFGFLDFLFLSIGFCAKGILTYTLILLDLNNLSYKILSGSI
tara:strand:+ start:378 stop:551 length:174 start_codon:yes stop_codon:yes gene_type:complete